MKYVSVIEYLMGRAKLENLSPELIGNVNTLIPKVNELLEAFGSYRGVNSGYRRPEDNAKVPHPKAKSAHLTCEAVDLEDKDGKLKKFCESNLPLLQKLGLWMESGASTPTWCHVQTRPAHNRIFLP